MTGPGKKPPGVISCTETSTRKLMCGAILLLALHCKIGLAAAAVPSSVVPRIKETEPPGLSSGQLANRQFALYTLQGSGIALYFGNGSLEGDAKATRAVIIVHGVLRNANTYFTTGKLLLQKARATKTLLIAPQFVEAGDLPARAVAARILRWGDDWPGGGPAVAPAPISTYSVLDAMLVRLADRSRFPSMKEVAVIGHSAGGQIVQRYAAVGRGPVLAEKAALKVHFVVANPSSYLYFDSWRPRRLAGCVGFDQWRYGFAGAPSYVRGSPEQLEQRYAKRNVTYLLGTADRNPREWDLDTSCAAEEQGPSRFSRGRAYISYLRMRNREGTAQDYAFVGGVGHDNRKMFASRCGTAVVFGGERSACAGNGKI